MRGNVNVTISSSDSATTSYYYEWFGYYEDYGVPGIEMDTTLMNESKTNDSVAALVAEREAIEDSVAQTKRTIREYVEKGILHVVNKYRPQAAKYYTVHRQPSITGLRATRTEEIPSSLCLHPKN